MEGGILVALIYTHNLPSNRPISRFIDIDIDASLLWSMNMYVFFLYKYEVCKYDSM